MQEHTKHAVKNISLWINIGCLISALLITATQQEWIKEYPIAVVSLGILNFTVTSILQFLRDMKKDGEKDGEKSASSDRDLIIEDHNSK